MSNQHFGNQKNVYGKKTRSFSHRVTDFQRFIEAQLESAFSEAAPAASLNAVVAVVVAADSSTATPRLHVAGMTASLEEAGQEGGSPHAGHLVASQIPN